MGDEVHQGFGWTYTIGNGVCRKDLESELWHPDKDSTSKDDGREVDRRWSGPS